MPIKIENVLTNETQIFESINKLAKYLKSDTRTISKYIESNNLFRETFYLLKLKEIK